MFPTTWYFYRGAVSHWLGMLLYAAALVLYTVRLGGLQATLVIRAFSTLNRIE